MQRMIIIASHVKIHQSKNQSNLTHSNSIKNTYQAFIKVPWVGLQSVIVVFPGLIHYFIW